MDAQTKTTTHVKTEQRTGDNVDANWERINVSL